MKASHNVSKLSCLFSPLLFPDGLDKTGKTNNVVLEDGKTHYHHHRHFHYHQPRALQLTSTRKAIEAAEAPSYHIRGDGQVVEATFRLPQGPGGNQTYQAHNGFLSTTRNRHPKPKKV